MPFKSRPLWHSSRWFLARSCRISVALSRTSCPRESMLPRPRLGGDCASRSITFSSITPFASRLIGLYSSCIEYQFTTMRQNANHRFSLRPKKSGNTAAGVPRLTGEGVNHLPGAAAVTNRDQVSQTSVLCCCPYFAMHLLLDPPYPLYSCGHRFPHMEMRGWLRNSIGVSQEMSGGERQMRHRRLVLPPLDS